MEGFVDFMVYLFQLIAPQPCFDEIFVKHNILDGTDYFLLVTHSQIPLRINTNFTLDLAVQDVRRCECYFPYMFPSAWTDS